MLRSTSPDVPRRRLDFALTPADVPRDFFAGDPALSLLQAAFSLIFPDGERFFVESVLRFRDRIDDPALMARVRGFAAQEAMHAKEHAAFNEVVERLGVSVMAPLGRDLGRLLAGVRRLSPEAQLAVTCALEHMTAVMGEQLLRDDAYRESIHPSVRGLWAWHALEECEHKDVAFDVYEVVGGGYLRRVAAMALVTLGFALFLSRAHVSMLRERGLLGEPRLLARMLVHQWVRPGIFRQIVPAYLAYYRPGFHPTDIETGALVARWRERLFGVEGELRAALEAAGDERRGT
jgi:predicted metal-dependent hydrolase